MTSGIMALAVSSRIARKRTTSCIGAAAIVAWVFAPSAQAQAIASPASSGITTVTAPKLGLATTTSMTPAVKKPAVPKNPIPVVMFEPTTKYSDEVNCDKDKGTATIDENGCASINHFLTVDVPRTNANAFKSKGNFTGYYTRIYVENSANVPLRINSSATEKRSWHDNNAGDGWDTLLGKSSLKILTLDVLVSSPSVKKNVTLASEGHKRDMKNGQVWTTEVNKRVYLTPYFRMDAASTISIKTKIVASRTPLDSKSASDLLEMIAKASELIAPVTKLLTPLTKENFKTAANFVDESLSTAFSLKIDEKSSLDYNIADKMSRFAALPTCTQDNSDDCDATLGRITAAFPDLAFNNGNTGAVRLIGRWEIKFDNPAISIFTGDTLCDQPDPANSPACSDGDEDVKRKLRASFPALSPWEVLNFPVDDTKTTLFDKIKAKSGFTETVAELNNSVIVKPAEKINAQDLETSSGVSATEEAEKPATAETKGDPAATSTAVKKVAVKDVAGQGDAQTAIESQEADVAASKLCSIIEAEAQIQELNRYDVAATVWAVSRSGMLKISARDKLMNPQNCTSSRIYAEIVLEKPGKAAQ